MIALLSQQQALECVIQASFLTGTGRDPIVTDELLAQLARRAINFIAPCAAHELAKAVSQSFAGTTFYDDALLNRVERVVEELIVFGDILEMRPGTGNAWNEGKSFVLLPAPPSFVARKNSSVAILGIAGDQITPLTAELESRSVYRGVHRIISEADADLQSHLVELGLLKLSERVWLRLPESETAAAHVASWRASLAREPTSSAIADLEILDTQRAATFYKDRWCKPERKHSGMFVARRPQRYGASLWCLVEIENGFMRRFKDLSITGDRLRPFDIAWRIQAALDALNGKPQLFRRSDVDAQTAMLHFYSPVPSWCERHLSITGQKTRAERCLFSFEMPGTQITNEISFLRDMLWMAKTAE